MKNKSKSKGHSKKKQLKKELESNLIIAFGNTIQQFGHAKKSKKTIEKFAKLIAKRIQVNHVDVPEVYAKAEEPANVEKTEAVNPKTKLVAKAKPIK